MFHVLVELETLFWTSVEQMFKLGARLLQEILNCQKTQVSQATVAMLKTSVQTGGIAQQTGSWSPPYLHDCYLQINPDPLQQLHFGQIGIYLERDCGGGAAT